MKATNLTQDHQISHHLLKRKDIATPRTYRKRLSTGERLLTSYYYTEKKKEVALITMEWPGLRRSDNRLTGDDRINEKQDVRPIYEWLAGWLQQQLGKPVSSELSADGSSLKWKRGNKKVDLDYRWGNVTLALY
ncbi:hypothetical protein ACTJIJ_24520 [Niabella sp. 22666]|uniref:hypothetical protein n=1 Tax=Niabella sp. 22666 TaxID=3453954 RepID=UPI003F864453